LKSNSDNLKLTAVQEFNSARLHAKLEQIKAALTGKSADLLSYEDVREKMKAVETNKRELKMIPLDSIVGSVGRYKDFTRHFFPLKEQDEQRWARVHNLVSSMEGLSPIEVFQVGEVYFVRDGNHRVSVARELEANFIEAYVTQVESLVSLEPNMQPDDLIIKERYAHFLQRTQLQDIYPDLNLSMSAAGNYRVLERQIGVHQHWIETEQEEIVSFPEAALRWVRDVYWPVIQMIRERGLMRDFPDRTETDLYVWIDKHRHDLAEHLGWTVGTETAVSDLAKQQQKKPKQAIQRMGEKIRHALTPDTFEAGPAVGEWREMWATAHRSDRMFNHILVALDGKDTGWHALEQALRIAKRENGTIFGLHIVSSLEKRSGEDALVLKAEFEHRCQQAGIPGEMTITTGPVTGTICYRARWADLVVISLRHPPGPRPVDRLNSQFGQLLRRCPRPVLAVPRTHAKMARILLAYDGSLKSEEAMFIATYLASQWQIELTVVVALSKGVTKETAVRVRNLLNERKVKADYVIADEPATNLIMQTAREQDCGLIVMGGYGHNPLLEIVGGSVVDEILRTRNRPVLVCR